MAVQAGSPVIPSAILKYRKYAVVAWILWPISAYVAVVSAYMLVVVIGSWLYRPPGGKGRGIRIAVIVPAHNEGAGILPTLRDLLACDYPRDLLEVMVIADNCTDDTASLARSRGVSVFERCDVIARGKGPALDWLLRTKRESLARFDVIAFVDADMFVDVKFAAALDECFADQTVNAVQARYSVANPTDSWLAAFGFMSFAYVNHVRPAGRCFLGGSAGLKGSGMAFRSSLILETGWPSQSIAEDLDFGKELTMRGVRIHYLPGAIVTSNIGSRIKQVAVQQARWEGGKHQAMMKFLPRVVRAIAAKPSALLIDELFDLLIPPLSLLVVMLLLSGATAILTGLLPLWLIVASVLVFAAAVATGLLQLRPPPRTLVYIAMAPLFIVLKLALFAYLAIKPRQADWNRTPRDGGNS
jgi:1,2-diacylglycerol 3-beta-glucosyltransferase